jgi:hypothetical protein
MVRPCGARKWPIDAPAMPAPTIRKSQSWLVAGIATFSRAKSAPAPSAADLA